MIFGKRSEQIYAPATGTIMSLQDVKDDVFSTEMMGPGLAIDIDSPELIIYAPIASTVEALYPTGHAIGLKTKNGTDVLLHVGLDSFKKKGLIKKHVSKGDRVRRGQLLVEINQTVADPTDLIVLLTFPALTKSLTPLYKDNDLVQARKQPIFKIVP